MAVVRGPAIGQIWRGAWEQVIPLRLRAGERAAAIYTLIETCKLNDVDRPTRLLADVLVHLATIRPNASTSS